MRGSLLLALGFAVLLSGCPTPTPPPLARVSLDRVEGPSILTGGSAVAVIGSFAEIPFDAVLDVSVDGATFSLPRMAEREMFLISEELVRAATDGAAMPVSRDVIVRLDGALESEPLSTSLRFALSFPLRLNAAPSGAVHYWDAIVLRGGGFRSESEGAPELCAMGTFTPDDDEPAFPVDACVTASLLDPSSRDRGIAPLAPAFGSAVGAPGTFDGSMWLARDDERTELVETRLQFGLPEVFGFDPEAASVESLVSILGAGLLGRAGDDATAVLMLEGEVRGRELITIRDEIVPEHDDRGAFFRLAAIPRDGRLTAELFGTASGTFFGSLTPTLVSDSRTVIGPRVNVELALAPVRQVVWLRFLPQFDTSLARFGLSAARAQLPAAIAARITALYRDYRVEVRLEEPRDVSPEGVTTIEIGGPDPEGVGLFGRDASPGKDVGNLRLFDAIGGQNADTQRDGFPGYGGVFIESFLYWSAHPELPIERPITAPSEDPLFDRLFDAVRLEPATLAELNGSGAPERVEVVGRASAALASMIGETAAHELGHAMGLAQPFGATDVFHNERDGSGCLMDRGADRPLAERVGESGTPTQLCDESRAYLRAILGE